MAVVPGEIMSEDHGVHETPATAYQPRCSRSPCGLGRGALAGWTGTRVLSRAAAEQELEAHMRQHAEQDELREAAGQIEREVAGILDGPRPASFAEEIGKHLAGLGYRLFAPPAPGGDQEAGPDAAPGPIPADCWREPHDHGPGNGPHPGWKGHGEFPGVHLHSPDTGKTLLRADWEALRKPGQKDAASDWTLLP